MGKKRIIKGKLSIIQHESKKMNKIKVSTIQ